MTRKLQAGAIVIAALATAPVLLLSYRNYWAVALVFFAAAVPGLIERRPRISALPRWSLPLFALLAYGMLSMLWSDAPRSSEVLWHVILALVSAVLIVYGRLTAEFIAYPLVFVLSVLFFDAVSGNGIRAVLPPETTGFRDAVGTGRGLTIALFLMPGALLAALRLQRRLLAMGLAVLAIAVALLSPVLLNPAAIAAGVVCGGFAFWRPRLGLEVALGFAALVLFSPLLFALVLPSAEDSAAITGLPESAVHRLVIWRTALDAWWEGSALFGQGARASEMLWREAGQLTLSTGLTVERLSVHPHNIALEVLYEFGAAGYLLLVTAFAWAAQTLIKAPLAEDVAAATAALIGISAMVMGVDFTLYNLHTVAGILVGAWFVREAARALP